MALVRPSPLEPSLLLLLCLCTNTLVEQRQTSTPRERMSGVIGDLEFADLQRIQFHNNPSTDDLLHLISSLRSSIPVVVGEALRPIALIFNGSAPERQNPELRRAIMTWEYHRFSGNGVPGLAVVATNPPFDHPTILSYIPTAARDHVYSLQLEVRSDHIVPADMRRFTASFPRLRDLYVDVIDDVEFSGGLFSGPSGARLFIPDDAAANPSEPPYPSSISSLAVTGGVLSRHVASVLDIARIRSLTLLDLIFRDAEHPTLMELLSMAPLITYLRIHAHWQYPLRQRDFWAPAPSAVLATLIDHINFLSLAAYKIDLATLVNAFARCATFNPRTVFLRLLCDCSDTNPTFKEIIPFVREILHYARVVEVDFSQKRVSTRRILADGSE